MRRNLTFTTIMLESEKTNLIHQIDLALDDIRPHLAVDGGDVTIMDLTEDMTVLVRWEGACETCSMSDMTMRAGVEQTIKARLPQIRSVKAVHTAHA